MQLQAAIALEGVFEPEDIVVLRSAFEKTKLDTDTDIDRETRAASLIRLFSAGARSEKDLLAALGFEAAA